MALDPVRPAKANQTAEDDPVEASRMSFGDHLDELRGRVILALVGVALTTILSLVFGKEILEIIYRPLLIVQHANGMQPSLQVLAPTAAFVAYLKIGFLTGLILAMPWVLYQIWMFVTTGLYIRERRFVRHLIPSSVVLFIGGVLFLYFIVLPIVLNFFISFNRNFGAPDLTPTWFQGLLLTEPEQVVESDGALEQAMLRILKDDPESPQPGEMWVNTTTRRLLVNTPQGTWSASLEPGVVSPPMHSQFALDFYVSFVLTLALAFGIAFETPVVVFFLAWVGIAPVATMAKWRRYVVLVAVIAAAMLTPPDVISQMLLAGPMYLLFELGLLVARLTERNTAASPAE